MFHQGGGEVGTDGDSLGKKGELRANPSGLSVCDFHKENPGDFLPHVFRSRDTTAWRSCARTKGKTASGQVWSF